MSNIFNIIDSNIECHYCVLFSIEYVVYLIIQISVLIILIIRLVYSYITRLLYINVMSFSITNSILVIVLFINSAVLFFDSSSAREGIWGGMIVNMFLTVQGVGGWG